MTDPDDEVDEQPTSGAEGAEPIGAPSPDWGRGLDSGLQAPGSIVFNPRASLFRPRSSTPLDEDQDPDDEVEIPAGVLWPMKQQRGFHPFSGAEDRFRVAIGEGEDPVYAIDDGTRKAIIGWAADDDTEGLAYSMVGKVKAVDLEFARTGEMTVEELLSTATGLALFSTLVAPEGVSNVLLMETYGTIEAVPADLLPGPPAEPSA